jgi:16S rRNA processing protein RimM
LAQLPPDAGDFVAVGKVQKPRGIRGEVYFFPLTDFPERFDGLETIVVEKPDGSRSSLDVDGVRFYGKRPTIKFRGVGTPEAVDRFRGSLLLVPRDQVHPLPEDTFYVFEVVGLKVETEDGEAVGQVKDVLSLPANDVYVVEREGKELLLPAVRDVMQVDLEGGRVIVRGVEDLL